MPKKNNVKLDAKAWDRIGREYEKWFDRLPLKNDTEFVNYIQSFSEIQQFVNAELKRMADAKTN